MPDEILPNTRAEAKRLGATYYSGRPCKQGHTRRLTSNKRCVECAKEYRKRNAERIRKVQHQWRLDNAERLTEYDAESYLRRKEHKWQQILDDRRRFYQENRERIRAAAAIYNASPRGKAVSKAGKARYRARLLLVPGTHTALDVEKIIAQGSRCFVCGKKFTKSNPPSIEHVIAVTHELGTNDAGNLAPTHLSCNQMKHTSRFNPVTGQGILI